MYRESRMGGGSRCFSPRQNILHEDGTLTIKASGWEDGETHWTGWMSLVPTDLDYDFWYWMAFTRQVSELVQESQIEDWKQEYRAACSRTAFAVH